MRERYVTPSISSSSYGYVMSDPTISWYRPDKSKRLGQSPSGALQLLMISNQQQGDLGEQAGSVPTT